MIRSCLLRRCQLGSSGRPGNLFLTEVIWCGEHSLHTGPHDMSGHPVLHTRMHASGCMTSAAHTGRLRYLVGFCQLRELLLGFGIILIRVWVVFLGQLKEETVNYYGHKMMTNAGPQATVTISLPV